MVTTTTSFFALNRTVFQIIAFVLLVPLIASSQYDFAPTIEHPFGLPNPDAPEQIREFSPMIGICDCKSISRNKDQTWSDTISMVWEFRYIMNGMGVQDLTLKEDGIHSGSIRQFNADSSKWYVHYFSSSNPSSSLSTWEGGKSNDDIVLFKEQKAPNGMEGFYKITFKDISEKGFNWVGEWITEGETFVFPTWKIFCTKRS